PRSPRAGKTDPDRWPLTDAVRRLGHDRDRVKQGGNQQASTYAARLSTKVDIALLTEDRCFPGTPSLLDSDLHMSSFEDKARTSSNEDRGKCGAEGVRPGGATQARYATPGSPRAQQGGSGGPCGFAPLVADPRRDRAYQRRTESLFYEDFALYLPGHCPESYVYCAKKAGMVWHVFSDRGTALAHGGTPLNRNGSSWCSSGTRDRKVWSLFR